MVVEGRLKWNCIVRIHFFQVIMATADLVNHIKDTTIKGYWFRCFYFFFCESTNSLSFSKHLQITIILFSVGSMTRANRMIGDILEKYSRYSMFQRNCKAETGSCGAIACGSDCLLTQ